VKTAIKKPIVILAVALIIVLAVLLLGMVPINVGFMKGPISAAARATTGLELAIGGPLTLRLGANPSISTGDIEYGEVPGEPLLEIESLYGRVALSALLAGRIHIREFRAQGVGVNYCAKLPQLADGAEDDEPPPRIAIDRFELYETFFNCGKAAQPGSIELAFSEISGAAPDEDDVRVRADGTIADTPVLLAATAGALNDLISRADQYPLDIQVDSEEASATVAARLEKTGTIIADIRAEVTDLRSTLGSFDVVAPDLGALRLEAQLGGDPVVAELDISAGELGDSRFVLDAMLDRSGARPHVRVAMVFEVLDVAPFLAGAAIDETPDEDAGMLDADLRSVIGALDVVNAEFELEANRIAGLPMDVEALEMSGNLSAGNLELRSVAADALGGRLSGSGRFDGGADCPALALSAEAADIDLATLGSHVLPGTRIDGRASSINLEAASCGHTIHEHRDSLQARVGLVDVHVSHDGRLIPLVTRRSRLLVAPGKRIRAELDAELEGVPILATLLTGTPEEFWNEESWPVELTIDGEGGSLRLRGTAAAASDKPYFDGSLELDAPKIGALHDWIGAAPETSMPLHGTSRLRFDRSTFAANKIAVSLGESNLGGRLAWHYGQEPDLLDIVLRSSRFDVAELAAAFPPDGDPARSPPNDQGSAAGSPRFEFTLPRADIDIALDAVHANQLDLQDIRIGGRLREGLIEDARVSLLVENDLLLRGGLDVNLRRLPATASLKAAADNPDFGKLLRRMGMETNLSMRADGIALDVSTQGREPRELVTNLQMEAKLSGFKWLIPQSFDYEGQQSADAFDFGLDELHLTMMPDEPAIWSSNGHFDGVLVELWMQTPSLTDMLDIDSSLPLTLALAAGNNVAMLDANIDLTASEELRGRIRISGAVVDSEDRELATLVAPLPDYELSSTVALSGERLTMPDLLMRLGSSSADGSITVLAGARTNSNVTLSAQRLQTDDLLYWSREFREAMSPGGAPGDEPVEESADPAPTGDTQERRGVLLMTRDLIQSFQEDNDLTMTVIVDDLYAGESPLGHAELHLYVDENDFRLQPLEFVLPGGGVSANYAASVADGRLDAGLKVSADALSYGGLLRLLDHESEARGLLYLDTEIRANTAMVPGKAPLELLLDNADGHIDFAAWPQNIEAGVLDLWTANLVLALLPVPKGGESARLNCLATRFKIDEGVMTSQTSLLDSTDTIIRGRGTIDLGEETLDLLVWPQAKREKFLSASTPVTVIGTFDDFSIGVEPAGFIGTLIRWYTSLIYVPFKWLTGERFPEDGTSTCFDAMDWDLTPELQEYFLRRDFSMPPNVE
jgi:uncharacterized protein involved in outer membrane biogenesis